MSPENRRGVITMTAAMVCFISNDALVKYVSASLPTPQLIFVRGLLTTLWLLAVVALSGQLGHWRSTLTPSIWVRSLLDSAATFIYLTSLFHLPLGNATAINLAAPLFLVLFAVLVLGERVSLGRWLMIWAGFAGVLLVVQPRADGFNEYAVLCVIGTLFHAARDLMTRRVPAEVPSLWITLTTASMVTLLAGLWTATTSWTPLEAGSAWRLAAASVLLATAYHLLTLSMRAGDMSVIGPFRYSGLLVALVLGFLVWGEVPNALAWVGIVLLVASGLGLLLNERARSRRAALDAATD